MCCQPNSLTCLYACTNRAEYNAPELIFAIRDEPKFTVRLSETKDTFVILSNFNMFTSAESVLLEINYLFIIASSFSSSAVAATGSSSFCSF